jgi:EmrB/QacA subfamily drug resistance transporter
MTAIHPLPAAPAGASGGTRHRTAALLLLCAAQFMVVLDASIVNVALPSLRADLGLSQANLQYVVSLYALTFGGFLILGGRAGDLYGRRRFFVLGMLVFSAASLVCGLAPNQETLLVGRALQGLGGAMVAPAALSLLTTIFTETRERNRALGAFGAVSGVGGAVGLILGGLITDGPGWQWIFFINIPIGAAAVVAAFALLPESAAQGVGGRLDLPGAVTITAGLAALIYGVTKGQELGFGDPLTVSLLAAAAVLLAAFLLVERSTASPLVALRVFRIRSLTGSNIVAVLLAGTLAGQSFFSSLYMQQVLEYSAIETGLAFLPTTALGFAGAALGSQLATRIGPRAVMTGAMALLGLSVLLLSGVSAGGSYTADLLPGLAVHGLGIGTGFVAVTIAATGGVPVRDQGLASGLINTSQQVGAAVGIAALVSVAASVTAGAAGTPAQQLVEGYQAGFLAAAGAALLGVLACLFVVRDPASAGDEPPRAPAAG